jgi:hypothetical protein
MALVRSASGFAELHGKPENNSGANTGSDLVGEVDPQCNSATGSTFFAPG